MKPWILLIFLAGCGLVGSLPETGSRTGAAIPVDRVTSESGDLNSSGEVGTVLNPPLSALIVDRNGDPIPNQTVEFSVTQGSALIIVASSTTDENGLAKASLQLGTRAEENLVRVRWLPDPNNDPNRTFVFHVHARAGSPIDLAFVSGAGQCGALDDFFPESVVIQVLDRFLNPVPAVEVTIGSDRAAIDSNPVGTLKVLKTDSNGKVQFRLRAGVQLGNAVVTAEIPAGPVRSIAYRIEPPITQYSPTTATDVQGGPDTPLIFNTYFFGVRVVGACGRPLPDALVRYRLAVPDTLLAEKMTDTNGHAETWAGNAQLALPGANRHITAELHYRSEIQVLEFIVRTW